MDVFGKLEACPYPVLCLGVCCIDSTLGITAIGITARIRFVTHTRLCAGVCLRSEYAVQVTDNVGEIAFL